MNTQVVDKQINELGLRSAQTEVWVFSLHRFICNLIKARELRAPSTATLLCHRVKQVTSAARVWITALQNHPRALWFGSVLLSLGGEQSDLMLSWQQRKPPSMATLTGSKKRRKKCRSRGVWMFKCRWGCANEVQCWSFKAKETRIRVKNRRQEKVLSDYPTATGWAGRLGRSSHMSFVHIDWAQLPLDSLTSSQEAI